MLYVHERVLDPQNTEDAAILRHPTKLVFDPLEDPAFKQQLYQKDTYGPKNREYKMRNGLTPGTKNIRANRWQRPLKAQRTEVIQVENILKDIIDFGFSDNVDEELWTLTFDGSGKMIKHDVETKPTMEPLQHKIVVDDDEPPEEGIKIMIDTKPDEPS